MANILEYTLSLQDRMSTRLRQIGINSDAALGRFAALQRRTQEVARTMNDSGRAIGALRQRLDMLRQEREWIPQRQIAAVQRYNREIASLERQINRLENTNGGSSIGRMFSGAMNQIPFANLLTNPLVIAGTVGAAALKKGIEADMQNTSFEVILGSEEAAKKLVADITKYGMETPYDKLGLGEAAKMMLGFGIAQDKVMPNLRAIGDIAMGDANKMNSLTLAFSQMSSAGKLQGQDLLQMINAGFNPLGVMSQKTGKSMATLRDEMSKGRISAQMVEDAFMAATSEGGQFHNMADRMGQQLGGRWAQLMDNISEKLLKFYEFIKPAAMALVMLAGSALDAASNGIGWLVEKFQEGHPVMMAAVWAIGSVVAAMVILKAASAAQAVWAGIVTIANNVQSASWWALNAAMLANPMTWIIAGVIALIALIGFLIYKVDGWGEAWHHTVEGVKSMFGGTMSFFKLQWLSIENLLLTGIEKLMIAWYKLKGLWDEEAANEGMNRIKEASDKRRAAIEGTRTQMQKEWSDTGEHFSKAAGSLKINDKGLGDFKDDLMGALGMGGISDPKVPGGGNRKNKLPGMNGESSLEKSNTGIATGGSKTNYITINLQELIGIKAENVNGSAQDMERMGQEATDTLIRVLASATTAGN